jgi:hypothetical protein
MQSGPFHLRMQGSPHHHHISGLASRFPKLPFSGLRVVCFVWSDQGDRAVEEYVVVCGLTSMLEIAWSIVGNGLENGENVYHWNSATWRQVVESDIGPSWNGQTPLNG